MNEQIKQLEKQAWDCVDQTWDWANPDNPSKVTLFKTKFAELIVKECAQVAKLTEADDGDDYKSGRQWAGIDVLKHFGVEE